MKRTRVIWLWLLVLVAMSVTGADPSAETAEKTETEKTEKSEAPAVAPTDTDLEATPEPRLDAAQLAERALEIEAREAALRELEAVLEARIEELQNLSREALAVLEPERKQREDEVKKLVSFYQGMKPKSAADLVEKLPLDLATLVMSRMKTREASKILNVMGKERAVEISKRIAGDLP